MIDKDRDDKLESVLAEVVNIAKESTKKIFLEGKHFGFKEGLSVADDYINTIIFKENARYPLLPEELDAIFGTDDSFKILSKYNIDHIVEKIKRYKNSKETNTDE